MPLEEALELATTIANKNPDAIQEAKRLLNDSALIDVAQGLAQEAAVTRRLLGTPNQLEAIAATFENRAPAFNKESEKSEEQS